MFRIARGWLPAVALGLLTAACSSGGDSGRIDPTTKGTVRPRLTTTVPATATSVIASPEATALEKLLSDRVPAGFRLTTFDVGDTGPSDLEKAIRDDGRDDAREMLTRARFVAGFQHLWVNDDGAEVIQFLYQFGDEQGAIAYADRSRAELEAQLAAASPQPFDAGVPGATALSAQNEDRAAAVVLFAKGPYFVQLVSSGAAGDDVVSPLTPLAQDQYARL